MSFWTEFDLFFGSSLMSPQTQILTLLEALVYRHFGEFMTYSVAEVYGHFGPINALSKECSKSFQTSHDARLW